MSQRFIALASVAFLSCVVETASAQSAGALRPEHPELKKMIETGSQQSPTFRHLVEQLDATSLVVYLRFNPCGGAVAACLRFVAPQGSARRVLIVLDRFGRSRSDLIALLAHELQHALEIAEAPQVVDDASFRDFYESSGLHVSAGYETTAATRTTRLVVSELSQRHP
jgi:hypothetical protein